MTSLSEERCLNHGHREAVARCPECRSFFCRECITEHEGRIICASCLRKQAGKEDRPERRSIVARALLLLVSIAIIWASFFVLGRTLLTLPDSFHAGTVWTLRGDEVIE